MKRKTVKQKTPGTMNWPGSDLDTLLGHAITQLQQGRLPEAEANFRSILNRNSAHADANHLLGVIALQRGLHDRAIELIRQAIQSNPGAALFYNNYSIALQGGGRQQDALAAAERAADLDPKLPEAHYNRGKALQELGRQHEALAAYGRVIQLNPQFTDAHFRMGTAWLASGRAGEAANCFRRVVDLDPHHAGAYNNLAVALTHTGEFEAALAACDHAAELVPDYAHAHNSRANALKKLYRLEDALAACEKAIEISPDYADAHYNRANLLLGAGRLDESEDSYRRALDLNPGDARLHSNLLFVMAARAHQAFDAMLAALRRWDEIHGQAGRAAAVDVQAASGVSQRRLRVGYVSPHLRSHVVSFFFEPLLAAHDRTRFEIFCYASFEESRVDAVSQRLRGHAEHWRFVYDLSDGELASQVRADGIDILVDLAGHTSDHRLGVFTYRPASVQASYLGFFASTGLAAMDYWITDTVLHPHNTQELATESIYRLPRCWVAYTPPESAPDVAPVPNPDARVMFGSFSNLTKLGPEVIETWSRILHGLPGSRLLLMAVSLRDPMVRVLLANRFAQHGIAADRLLLRPGAPYREYFATYAEVDIVLDPFPRTGGTTTAEALWMGVPAVTLAGQRYVERISASKLTALGLQELIAHSREDYVDKAITLARDPARRVALRASLRDTMARSPLCDGAGLARAMETAYQSMMARRVSGLG